MAPHMSQVTMGWASSHDTASSAKGVTVVSGVGLEGVDSFEVGVSRMAGEAVRVVGESAAREEGFDHARICR